MTNTYTTQKKTIDFINKQMDKGALKTYLHRFILNLVVQKQQHWQIP